MQDIVMQPVGFVENHVADKKDDSWGEDVSVIRLKEAYRGGLKGLEDFSHALILCYLDKAKYVPEKHLCRRPQGRADMPLVGIFAQRTKDRPNAIGVTAVEILSADECSVTVKGLDAINGTPVLDIKPYFPAFDQRDSRAPEWVMRLMETYF